MRDDHASTTAVQVALRIRPLTERDRSQPRYAHITQGEVLQCTDKTVHVVPHNRNFNFDHVFGPDSRQSDIFKSVAERLIHKFIEGYNVTILAYGQTSSGKTYTMGTSQHSGGVDPNQEGIVPRSMALLFDLLHTSQGSKSSQSQSFNVKVSFIELYNEEIKDLLTTVSPYERPPVVIREDTKGHIFWTGVKDLIVNSVEDVLNLLEQGTRNRATGATDMNEQSSRSHAVFSVTLEQKKWISAKHQSSDSSSDAEGDWMITVSKFHFVDLAGSERLKRTAAEGDRRKEGININAGLLALGNVISALGDSSKRSTHVPYRDSKLTRLLQDSLGGNSTTLMIACVSPVEYNLSETMSTLQYANRARNIRNRAEKNEMEEWMTTDNIELLRNMVARLKQQARRGKQNGSPPTVSGRDSPSTPIPARGGASLDADRLVQEYRTTMGNLQQQVDYMRDEISRQREKNTILEHELERQSHRASVGMPSPQINANFPHLVEPVIEEYEKSVSAVESQLALTRAALNHADEALQDQQIKLESYIQKISEQNRELEGLRLSAERYRNRAESNQAYIEELETRLISSTDEAIRDRELLDDLRTRIVKLRETDEATEKYVAGLESRLQQSDLGRSEAENRIKALEMKLAEANDIRKLQFTPTDDMETLQESDGSDATHEDQMNSSAPKAPDTPPESRLQVPQYGMHTPDDKLSYLEEQLQSLQKVHAATLRDLDHSINQHQEATDQIHTLNETVEYYQDAMQRARSAQPPAVVMSSSACQTEPVHPVPALEHLHAKVEDLETQNAECEAYIAHLESLMKHQKKATEDNEIVDDEPVSDSVSDELEMLRQDYAELKKVRDRFKDELNHATEMHIQEERQLKDALVAVEKQINTMKLEKGHATLDIQRLQESLDDHRLKFNDTQNELDEYRESVLVMIECCQRIRKETGGRVSKINKSSLPWQHQPLVLLHSELLGLETILKQQDDAVRELVAYAEKKKSPTTRRRRDRIMQRRERQRRRRQHRLSVSDASETVSESESSDSDDTEDTGASEDSEDTDVKTSQAMRPSCDRCDQVRQEAEASIELLENELKKSAVQIAEMHRQLRKAEEMTSNVCDLMGKLQVMEDNQNKLEMHIAENNLILERQRREIESKNQLEDVHLETVARLESTIDGLMRDLDLAQEAYARKEEDILNLQASLDVQACELEALQANAIKRDSYASNVTHRSVETDSTMALETQLRQLREDNQYQADLIDKMTQELQQGQNALQAAESKIKSLDRRTSQGDDACRLLKRQLQGVIRVLVSNVEQQHRETAVPASREGKPAQTLPLWGQETMPTPRSSREMEVQEVHQLKEALDRAENVWQERNKYYTEHFSWLQTKMMEVGAQNHQLEQDKGKYQADLEAERAKTVKVQHALESQIEALLGKKKKFMCF